jgi:DNA helicase-2/ATP-dependent DNA helicase PcrA
VRVRGVWDGEAEARLVADDIEAWRRDGRRYRDAAVLVRASFQMRAFEERFVMLQIPYSVVGGPRFFERAEVRDVHAYLRLVQSPDDDLAFERIVNTPKRGIGDASVAKLLGLARAQGLSAVAAARELVLTDELAARTRTALSGFLRDLDRWRLKAREARHSEVAETILEESGYTDALRADRGPQSQGRLDNLKELIQAMSAFDTLESYLEHVSLVMDLDRATGDDTVQIMTLHSAKGLEFPLVFLPGWEEGMFPSQRSMDEKGEKGLEEERRLAYVGLTRAREEARISFVANRQIYGRWTTQLPSRFVDELPPAHVEAKSETGYYGAGPGMSPTPSRWDAGDTFGGSSYTSPGWKRAQDRSTHAVPEKGRGSLYSRSPVIEGEGRLIASADPAAGSGLYTLGDRVFHQKFGYGRIVLVEGAKLTVAFETSGEKRVLDSFVEKA